MTSPSIAEAKLRQSLSILGKQVPVPLKRHSFIFMFSLSLPLNVCLIQDLSRHDLDDPRENHDFQVVFSVSLFFNQQNS